MKRGWVWDKFNQTARNRSGEIAVEQDDRNISFGSLLEKAQYQAQALEQLHPRDRVVIAADNSIEVLVAVAATWARGAIPVMCYAAVTPTQLVHIINETEPTYVLTDQAHDNALIDSKYAEWPAAKKEKFVSAHDVGSDDTASILFTSGSTGQPKGVMQSAYNLIDGASRMTTLMKYSDKDKIVCPVPFAFDYGWGHLLSMFLEGVSLVLPEPLNSFGLCSSISKHRPTVLAAVPSLMAELIYGLAPIREINRSSIRLITSTGSKFPESTLQETRALFPDAEISLNYGLTETYRSASLLPEDLNQYPNSVGKPVPGVNLSIMLDNGKMADIGETGEILHQGKGIFTAYWNAPSRTAATIRPHPENGNSAVFTGDLGYFDGEGNLYITGRRDRQMKSMGVRISPDEIEELLMQSGLLETVSVTCVPHEIIGDLVVACVISKIEQGDEKQLIKSLRQYARNTMGKHMQPRKYLSMSRLPTTSSDKIDYPALRILAESSE